MARLRIGACLSLSGRYAQFGRQAAQGLAVWRSLDGAADLVIEDDHSDRRALEAAMAHVAPRSDVLLGPYSTQLMRVAGRVAAESGWLVWNHGGSGDDVEAGYPGHVVSVLTPTSRYADPFLQLLAAGPPPPAALWVTHGKGSFGRQVADGAETTAGRLGIPTVRTGPGELPFDVPPPDWGLLCAGLFEEDVQTVGRALNLPHPPRLVCAVAAGVREFGRAVSNPEGIFGVAQWFPGSGHTAKLGPAEPDFLSAYAGKTGELPDYPAVQAVASAVLAAHCARLANGTAPELLWPVAATLDTMTLFGGFQIDPVSGAQIKHQTVLVRWTTEEPAAVQASAPQQEI